MAPFALVVLVVVTIGALQGVGDEGVEDLTYSTFLQRVEDGEVAQVTLFADGRVEGQLSDDGEFTSVVPTAVQNDELVDDLRAADVEIEARPPQEPGLLASLLVNLLPFLLLGGLVWFFIRRAREQGGGMNPLSGIGKSKAEVVDTERPDAGFDDVAGYESVKTEIKEVVQYLQQPQRYERIGARGPGGVLLVGPPGTGKTLMARAVAGEAGVPFISAAGSEFVEMLVGVGASRVRDLFEKARDRAPAIIFVDELDSLGRRRGASTTIGSNNEQEQTLNQLLAEMDGFDPTSGVVVLAASNRPEMLDPALTRPGRFDRRIRMDPPTLPDRMEILALHTQDKRVADDLDLRTVARATPGFSGAELENLTNEAAMIAVRRGHEEITDEDFDAARDRLVLGRRDESIVLTDDEQRRVAVHEAGHALLAALREDADPVSRVTALPSGRALGATHQLPLNEHRLYPEGYLRARIDVALGGRAAELVVLDEASSGAANDLAQATSIATRMVRDLGFSSRLGPIGYGDAQQESVPPALRSRPFAEDTQRVLDEEVAEMLRDAQQRAISDLREHRDELDALVERLLEEETIDGEVVYDLVGRPVPRPDEDRHQTPEDGHEAPEDAPDDRAAADEPATSDGADGDEAGTADGADGDEAATSDGAEDDEAGADPAPAPVGGGGSRGR